MMKPIQKYIFASIVPISTSLLTVWLKKYRNNLEKLGQKVRSNTLNYLAVLYICQQEVIDPREVYPEITQEEINTSYQTIKSKLNE